MHYRFTSLLGALLLAGTSLFSQTNPLEAAWTNQVKPLGHSYLSLTYEEKANELHHSMEPWQETSYKGKGLAWISKNRFSKWDTLTRTGGRGFVSKKVVTDSMLLWLDYGAKDIAPVTKSMRFEHAFLTARYSPVNLLDVFYRLKRKSAGKDAEHAIYTDTLNRTIVSIYIRNSDKLVSRITTLSYDPFHGDVLTAYDYSEYTKFGAVPYPALVSISKINGRVNDEVKVTVTGLVDDAPVLLEKPADYTVYEDAVPENKVKSWKFNDRIHFLDLLEVGEQVMVAEFGDFLFVAEAPLSSENGEIIIREAKKIAPNKPIRFFSFGHHHPHYTGGMRSFVNEGATILCSRSDSAYVTYLTTAPHRLKPDRQQRDPKPVQMNFVEGSKVISDGTFEMRIIFIGEKSGHTKDYLVYYFPQEKLLYEGDLAWIPKEGAVPRATKTQAGLHSAIKEAGIQVDTIVQSWRTGESKYKTRFTFAELEASMDKEQ
jgi:glyoxylase-like metal-dependent hydrolase (beta-lactamase superfamily II)